MPTSSEKKEMPTTIEELIQLMVNNKGKTLASFICVIRMAVKADELPTYLEEVDWALYIVQSYAETIKA